MDRLVDSKGCPLHKITSLIGANEGDSIQSFADHRLEIEATRTNTNEIAECDWIASSFSSAVRTGVQGDSRLHMTGDLAGVFVRLSRNPSH